MLTLFLCYLPNIRLLLIRESPATASWTVASYNNHFATGFRVLNRFGFWGVPPQERKLQLPIKKHYNAVIKGRKIFISETDYAGIQTK